MKTEKSVLCESPILGFRCKVLQRAENSVGYRAQNCSLLYSKGFSSLQIWGMLCSKVFVNALNFEHVRFFKAFNNERSFALVSNACFIEPLSMHVYRILFFIEI